MPSPITWMVRAGRGAARMDDFLENNVVALGWGDLPDLTNCTSRAQVLELVRAQWPDWKSGKQISSAGQLFRFIRELNIGDRVLSYDPQRRVYNIADIIGTYQYNSGSDIDHPHQRAVKWLGEVPRDQLSVKAKNSLGSISTLFLVPEHAAAEVSSILAGHSPILATPDESPEDNEELLFAGIENKAIELIKDKISALDWEEMQELVAGILRAMGYKTRVSAKGADRGKDIVASPDGFGFESPRIVVEVKHRGATMGAPEIRSFLGGRHADEKGLYVSTGGFSKEARYEAERANIPLTLMSLDELVFALLEHYDQLDLYAKQLVPLKRIYWPLWP